MATFEDSSGLEEEYRDSVDLRDDYPFQSYCLKEYRRSRGAPLIRKRSRVIAAVVNNQVNVLKDLLDSRRWYYVRDRWGFNLLQIAIFREKVKVFNYLLSIPEFPIEFVSCSGHSALVTALEACNDSTFPVKEYFALELLKRGVDTDYLSEEGNTLLYQALQRNYCETAKILIERGTDVNSLSVEPPGFTPLEAAFHVTDSFEIVCDLLLNGATPTVEIFTESVVLHKISKEVQEILFLYTRDLLRESEITFDVILQLALTESPLFEEIIDLPLKITVEDPQNHFIKFCVIKTDYLRKIMTRFASHFGEILTEIKVLPRFESDELRKLLKIENLDVMLQSDFKYYVINMIISTESCHIVEEFREDRDLHKLTELYCFLLSYGLNICDTDLEFVYEEFGYCELFKILLHFDMKECSDPCDRYNLMPRFIYDVGMTLEKFMQDPESYCNSVEHIELDFLSYFAHPKFVELYEDSIESGDLPTMPSLLELSRNKFRQVFIKKCNIKSSKEFFTLLNHLQINNVFKKIISYETKLYNI